MKSRYINPIPTLDAYKQYTLTFCFEEEVTKEAAAEGIMNLIKETGEIPVDWVKGKKEVLR
ncbi:hypothetical protein [Tissierella sp.]|uniref:hypothetical protein n=1 Tax=Tissierella sp. TaxID=41274 RepID=UPI0028544259|nr:hypothetical protein [Tissierella sp.]MDR7856337.1 hypothetical protein [Tissierella sp.]